MNIRNCPKSSFAIFLVIICSLFITGCLFSSNSSKPQEESTQPPVASEQIEEEPKKPTAIYHDFEDVIVPMELSVVKDRTVIVSTPGFKSGILTLKGRVESNSLYNFFSVNMEKDNWQVISRIKSPETTIMVYQKTARCAVITIRDEQIYTYVEIGVAPTMGGGPVKSSGSLTY
ncbi:MAG: hypothetical protein MI892_02000 [Desulfobacterales bacterium]|nr:hypothetical protein [Desulfobacterales bacterium]